MAKRGWVWTFENIIILIMIALVLIFLVLVVKEKLGMIFS